MNIKIEKNIPIAKRAHYPFAEMKVGDSFHIDDITKRISVATLAAIFSKKNNNKVKFSVRKEGEGFRCWRIK